MTKIFATGVTGYIGGDALNALVTAHPEYDITALVRNTDKGAKVAAQYSKVKLVYGDLNDVELLAREARGADIVAHWADADHEAAAHAIIKGLAARDSESPGFLIHTSGTGVLLWEDLRDKSFGKALREKVYDDLENVGEVTSLPDSAPHRAVDKIVLGAAAQHGDRVKTAVVCPPTIYGEGRGPDNTRSIQIPDLVKISLENGQVVQVNDGKAWWNHIHVSDLSQLYLRLIEEAAAGGSTAEWNDKPAVWGEQGYYFCENGEHIWGEVSKWIAEEAKKQGLVETDEVQSISAEDANQRRAFGMGLWGGNSRGRAKRAKEVLRWTATGPSLQDEVKSALQIEAARVGVKQGHARVAAGDA